MTANLENIHEIYNIFCQKNRMNADIINLFDQAVQGTGQCPAEKPRLARSLRKMGRTLTCPCATRRTSIYKGLATLPYKM